MGQDDRGDRDKMMMGEDECGDVGGSTGAGGWRGENGENEKDERTRWKLQWSCLWQSLKQKQH